MGWAAPGSEAAGQPDADTARRSFMDLLSDVTSKAAATVGNNLSQSEAPTHAIHLLDCGRR